MSLYNSNENYLGFGKDNCKNKFKGKGLKISLSFINEIKLIKIVVYCNCLLKLRILIMGTNIDIIE